MNRDVESATNLSLDAMHIGELRSYRHGLWVTPCKHDHLRQMSYGASQAVCKGCGAAWVLGRHDWRCVEAGR